MLHWIEPFVLSTLHLGHSHFAGPALLQPEEGVVDVDGGHCGRSGQTNLRDPDPHGEA